MVHVLVGALLVVLGYFVRYKQWSWLIAGYNTSSRKEKAKYDTPALCRAVGNLLFLLGGIVLVGSLGELLDIEWILFVRWILFTVVSLGAVIYLNTGNRFKKKR